MYDYLFGKEVDLKGHDTSGRDVMYGADFLSCEIHNYDLETAYFIPLLFNDS